MGRPVNGKSPGGMGVLGCLYLPKRHGRFSKTSKEKQDNLEHEWRDNDESVDFVGT